jgi:hypothetical protein
MGDEALLSREDILIGLREMNELALEDGNRLELTIAGGAMMVLKYPETVRAHTKDIDVFVDECDEIYFNELARKVAMKHDWDERWINSAVMANPVIGVLSEDCDFGMSGDDWPGVYVKTLDPRQALAMKCIALRDFEDTHDYEDARVLMKDTGIATYDQLMENIYRFIPKDFVDRRQRLDSDLLKLLDSVLEESGSRAPSAEDPRKCARWFFEERILSPHRWASVCERIWGSGGQRVRDALSKMIAAPEDHGLDPEAVASWGERFGTGRMVSKTADGVTTQVTVHDGF